MDIYLSKVEKQLKVYKGKVWWTGTKHDTLKSMPMGKNMFTKMPHLVAELLSLPEPDKYTFHSFRRTAATSAADASATSDQMVDFFGWEKPIYVQRIHLYQQACHREHGQQACRPC